MTRWGIPDDPVALAALVVSVLGFVLLRSPPRFVPSTNVALGALCALSFVLSALYVEYYLRGGPRIIDATTYYLQARTYATGQLGFTPEAPEASHFGRFLLSMPDGRLSSLFPPGYPALLALGFFVGLPLWLGPLLAAGITAGTFVVANQWFGDRRLALLAAAMSTLSAALRYHTADTMSHGLCALLTLGAVACVASPRRSMSVVSGLLLGWLFATRPVSALALAPVLGAIVFLRHASTPERGIRALLLLSCLVGVGLFAWQQQEVTGAWGVSTQYRYYALADTPGCFRFGFGSDIGCRGEHGAFVDRYLPNGYGLLEASWTTFRRLAAHSTDAGNSELFGALVLVALWVGRRETQVRLLGAALLLHVVAYSGFYFDGNYPGGGGRMFIDVMPFEHVLLAWLFVRSAKPWLAIPLMSLGFALHTSFAHGELAAREGGAPMYDATRVARETPARALVFVASDHGYALGHDPSGRGRLVVRHKGDALDFAAWKAAGSPPSYRYEFDFTRPGAVPRLTPFEPPVSGRFEFENQWPPVALTGAAERRGDPTCGAGLELKPLVNDAHIEASLWVDAPGPRQLKLRGRGDLALRTSVGRVQLAESAESSEGCKQWVGELNAARAGNLRIQLSSERGAFLDHLELGGTP